jgi:osmotically-inducible protein OsmY
VSWPARTSRKIRVRISNGSATLSGQVRSLWAKEKAIRIALSVPEVTDVISELKIAAAESDEDLAKQIKDKILRYVFYTIFHEVGISVEKGVLTLSERVTMPHKANEISELVSKRIKRSTGP